MAYFKKDDYGNVWYSYYGVSDCILADYTSPEKIEAYLDDEVFQQAVINSYEHIDLSGDNEKNISRVHSAAINGSWCGAERQLCAVNGRGVSKVFPCQW